MRQVAHPEYQSDFEAGFNSKVKEIQSFGLESAQASYDAKYPDGYKWTDLAEYYHAAGEAQALYR